MSPSIIIPSCAAVIGGLYSIHAMRVKGRENYGLYLIGSPSFGLFILSIIFGILTYGNFYGLELNQNMILSIHPNQAAVYLLATIATSYIGLTWNVRRSNPPFGLAFSIIQLLVGASLILVIVWLFSRRRAPPVITR